MSNPAPSLDVIIVNWNAGRQLLECLESLASARMDGFVLDRVVVVDNASTDASMRLPKDLKLPLVLIHNPVNRGFGAACNQGVSGTSADYLLFLNPDTRLYADSLCKPIRFMERPDNSRIGICGIQLINDYGQVSRSCARFPRPSLYYSTMLGLDLLLPRSFLSSFMVEWEHDVNREVDQVMGAFFLVRHSLFQALGGFDERFFVYMEDVDFSYRASRSGWCSIYLAEARAYHRGGGLSSQAKARRLFFLLRSRILYGYKHFSKPAATQLLLGTLLIEPWSRVFHSIASSSLSSIRDTLSAYALLLRSLPAVLLSVFSKDLP